MLGQGHTLRLLDEARKVGRHQHPGPRKPGQSAHDWSTQGAFPWMIWDWMVIILMLEALRWLAAMAQRAQSIFDWRALRAGKIMCRSGAASLHPITLITADVLISSDLKSNPLAIWNRSGWNQCDFCTHPPRCPSFPCFWGNTRKTNQETRVFYPTESLKSLEKKGKTVKEQGISRSGKKKTRNSPKTRIIGIPLQFQILNAKTVSS